MFSRKMKTAPPMRPHFVSVRFGRLMEVQAEGWGIVAAPILALVVVIAVAMGVWFAGTTAATEGAKIVQRLAQAEPAVDERPPPMT